jgi:hypothetical protein
LHSPTFAHSTPRLLRLRRSSSAVVRLSSVARRTHAAFPPDLAVRKSSAAPPSRPQHSCFSAPVPASPSTVYVGDRRPAPSPVKVLSSDRTASG